MTLAYQEREGPAVFSTESETTSLLNNAHNLSKTYHTIEGQQERNQEGNNTITDADPALSYNGTNLFSRRTAIKLSKIKRVLQTDSFSLRPSWFYSWKKGSQLISIDPSSRSRLTSREPLAIFKDLIDLLVTHHVPGPMLFRMKTEFNHRLGHGRTFETFGVSDARYSEEIRVFGLHKERVQEVENIWNALPRIAVKRAYVDNRGVSHSDSSSSSASATRAFGQQLYCIEREIRNLCHPQLRNHPNIVKLLSWGLCLDTLEDVTGLGPTIPLLVLERADYSLADFITRHPLNRAGIDVVRELDDDYQKLCIDIGNGLEAIHDAGMIHGDVKLQNILIFREKDTWVARLSDFGLTMDVHPRSSNSDDIEYRGTPQWCPPPGSSRYIHGDLYSFDYFAYGLVLWCLFIGQATSPLPPDQAITGDLDQPFGPSKLYKTAVSQLKISNSIMRDRVRYVLRGCLHDDSRLWLRRPWQYFDETKYPTVGRVTDFITPAMLVNIFAVNIVKKCGSFPVDVAHISRHLSQRAAGKIKQVSIRNYAILESFGKSSVPIFRSDALTLWRNKLIRNSSPLRIELEKAARLMSASFRIGIDPGAIHILYHPPRSRCRNYVELINVKIRNIISHPEQVYAQARLRSRIPRCCYYASGGDNTIISVAISHQLPLISLAWLCRGEIGYDEVASLSNDSLVSALDPYYDRVNLGSRFVLLAESGCQLNKNYRDSYEEKASVLRGMFEALKTVGPSHTVELILCLTRLQRFAKVKQNSTRLTPALRYFLTGYGLPDGVTGPSDSEEFWTTALHECVTLRIYDAVEALVLGGFEVNCLDAAGRTALQLLFEQREHEIVERIDIDLESERIIALLRQRPAKVWHPDFLGDSTTSKSLPMGWNEVTCRVDALSRDPLVLYQERHFGSITFQRPTFSFFSDQRLALGFRRVVIPGQAYYLDLLRFIIEPLDLPDRSKPIDWKFSQEWYAQEATRSDELQLYTAKDVALASSRLLKAAAKLPLQGAVALFVVLTSHKDAYGQTYRLLLETSYILELCSPLFPYLLYGFIPLSWAFSGIHISALKFSLEVSALIALCNMTQGALAFLLDDDGSGYILAACCNVIVEFTISILLVHEGIFSTLCNFLFAVIILNAQMAVAGTSLAYFVRDHGALRLYVISFLALLYMTLSTQSPPSWKTVLTAPILLIANWIVFLLVFLSLRLRSGPISRFILQYRKTIKIASFYWLWSGNDDNVITKTWRKGYLPRRSRRILTLVLTFSVICTIWTSYSLVKTATHASEPLRDLLLCICVPLATRATFVFKAIRRKPLWEPKVTYNGALSLVPLPVGSYFSPSAHTFILFAIFVPATSLALYAKGAVFTFALPTLDCWRLAAIILAFANAVFLRLRMDVRRIWLDLFLVHCLCYAAYQAYLATYLAGA